MSDDKLIDPDATLDSYLKGIKNLEQQRESGEITQGEYEAGLHFARQVRDYLFGKGDKRNITIPGKPKGRER